MKHGGRILFCFPFVCVLIEEEHNGALETFWVFSNLLIFPVCSGTYSLNFDSPWWYILVLNEIESFLVIYASLEKFWINLLFCHGNVFWLLKLFQRLVPGFLEMVQRFWIRQFFLSFIPAWGLWFFVAFGILRSNVDIIPFYVISFATPDV